MVDAADDAVPPSVVPQRGAHEDVDRVDVVGEAAGREQRLAVRGITGLSLRVAEPEEQRGPTARIVGGGPVQQIERIPVPAQRLVGRELRQGPIARPLRVRDRLARVRGLGGARPVVGELPDPLAGIVATELLERLRDRSGGRARAGRPRDRRRARARSARARTCSGPARPLR